MNETASTEERPAPRRLRAADVIDSQAETIRALTERRTSGIPNVSCDFTRNAKGETQIKVEVDANLEANMDDVRAHALSVVDVAIAAYERAAMRFPTAEGTVTNDDPPKTGEKEARAAAAIARARAK